ncbi:hypothetical protein HDU93_005815 [Gonapodya sp. JEL0774]|nr:hypothetical protein HDU93_005815 [Gonapodya sp. JEL0774]
MFGWLKKQDGGSGGSGSGGGRRGGKRQGGGGKREDDGFDYASLGIDPSLFKIPGIDGTDGMDANGDDTEGEGLDENDIDDPKLLRELNALIAAEKPKKPPVQSQSQLRAQPVQNQRAPSPSGRAAGNVAGGGGDHLDIHKVHAELASGLDKDLEVEFTEEDENDPALLVSPKPDLDIDALHARLSSQHGAASIGGYDQEPEVELTEEDERDPGLLAELSAISGVPRGSSATAAVLPTSSAQLMASTGWGPLTASMNDGPTASYPSKQNYLDPASSIANAGSHNDADGANLPDDDPASGWLDSTVLSVPEAGPMSPHNGRGPVVAPPPRTASSKTGSAPIGGSGASVVRPPVGGVSVFPAGPPLLPPAPIVPAPRIDASYFSQLSASYKSAALAHKRASDIPGARALLSKAKEMDALAERMKSGGIIEQGWEAPDRDPEVWLKGMAARAGGQSVPQQAQAGNKAPFSGRQQQHPQLQQHAVNSATTSSPAPRPAPRAPPLTPPPSTGGSVPPNPPTLPPSAPPHFQSLVATLHRQAQLAHMAAAFQLARGDKARALYFHQRKKRDLADMKALEQASKLPRGSIREPVVVFEPVRYEFERTNADLAMAEVEVTVVGADGLRHPTVQADQLETTLTWDVGYPVGDDGNTKPEGKGETPPAKGGAPRWNARWKVRLERNKTAHRWAERKRVEVQLWYNRGFFWGKECLGKGSAPIADLMTKCEVELPISLTDPASPRQKTGVTVSVRLRLRTPLARAELVQEEERWATLDFGGSAGAAQQVVVARPPSTPQQLPAPSVPVSVAVPVKPVSETAIGAGGSSGRPTPPPSVAGGGVAYSSVSGLGSAQPTHGSRPVSPTSTPSKMTKQPNGQTGTQIPSASSLKGSNSNQHAFPTGSVVPTGSAPTGGAAPSLSAADADLEALIDSFDSPESIVSNEVMMHEVAVLEKEIAAARSGGLSARDRVEELVGRKQGIEIKMQILAVMVQTGKLEMPDYSKQLASAITEAKSSALQFKRAGRVDYAKKALERAKIMEKEMAEVEQMIKEDAEES